MTLRTSAAGCGAGRMVEVRNIIQGLSKHSGGTISREIASPGLVPRLLQVRSSGSYQRVRQSCNSKILPRPANINNLLVLKF